MKITPFLPTSMIVPNAPTLGSRSELFVALIDLPSGADIDQQPTVGFDALGPFGLGHAVIEPGSAAPSRPILSPLGTDQLGDELSADATANSPSLIAPMQSVSRQSDSLVTEAIGRIESTIGSAASSSGLSSAMPLIPMIAHGQITAPIERSSQEPVVEAERSGAPLDTERPYEAPAAAVQLTLAQSDGHAALAIATTLSPEEQDDLKRALERLLAEHGLMLNSLTINGVQGTPVRFEGGSADGRLTRQL